MSGLDPEPLEFAAHWYAGCTRSRHEKRVARDLEERGVECFLPLFHKVHQWSHDHRKVELPLFPGYVFVHITLRERLHALQIPGLVRLVTVRGVPAPIDDTEIETLRYALANSVHTEPCPYIKLGQQVRIESGPLQGLCGKVLRKNHHLRVVISIDLLMRSVVVDVDAGQIAA